ncbi:MAG: GNAT family N-acetyltransferase [Burkholderiaceae bacterium]|nr:GNAT family N-acetyltransferase [Burkholderiaceae bacterium]
MRIRAARADEATLLGAIAFEAKSHWNYPPEVMDGWRGELVVRLDCPERRPTFVAEDGGAVIGFCQVGLGGEVPSLEHLWVRPACMGRGVGRALLERASALLTELGHTRMRIDADPNAEAFYRHCGAIRDGEVAAPIAGEPDRIRPQMALVLAPQAPPSP